MNPPPHTIVDFHAISSPSAQLAAPCFLVGVEQWKQLVAPPGKLGIGFEHGKRGHVVFEVDPEAPLAGAIDVDDELVALGGAITTKLTGAQLERRFGGHPEDRARPPFLSS